MSSTTNLEEQERGRPWKRWQCVEAGTGQKI